MNIKTKIVTGLILFLALNTNAQEKKYAFSVKGDMGIWYEGYGLDKNPSPTVPDFYSARKPWNLVRYS
ncbi:MAG: hypothetical protein ACOH1N_07880, partial [Lutibacter sp.]